jgi:hypothetical protein
LLLEGPCKQAVVFIGARGRVYRFGSCTSTFGQARLLLDRAGIDARRSVVVSGAIGLGRCRLADIIVVGKRQRSS